LNMIFGVEIRKFKLVPMIHTKKKRAEIK
jgi:hypothetical protein